MSLREKCRERNGKEPTCPIGNLYLFFLRLAMEVDQIMKPDITSKTASRVVTMMESEPLMVAIATRTTRRMLQKDSQKLQTVTVTTPLFWGTLAVTYKARGTCIFQDGKYRRSQEQKNLHIGCK
jgi:hypothetical protein